jgi:glucose/arabinose dehydrogenase
MKAMRTAYIGVIAVSALAVVAGAWQVAGERATSLPAPFATPSANNRPRVIPAPSGAKVNVPKGFTVDVWAEGFRVPRFILQGEHNEILLADSGGNIYAFPNGDPKQRKEVVSGIERPYGLALWHEYLYVGTPTSIKRFKYDPATFTAADGQEIFSLAGDNQGHWTRSLLFDRAGAKLYVGVGSAGNIDVGNEGRAAIHQMNPDGSGNVLYASGTRNPIGLHWYPGTDTLWAVVQERDALGDDLVPDYFTHIQPQGFYGYPWAYSGHYKEPRQNECRPQLSAREADAMIAKSITPDLLLGAHVAGLDYTFYTGKQFPAKYRDGAFIAFHGSWNRSKRVGYEVAFVPFKDGKPVSGPEDFMTGFMLSPESQDVWGRPVAVFQMKDGSLLVTDDGGRKIWRIAYQG